MLRIILICAIALTVPAVLCAREIPGHMVLNGDVTAVMKTPEGAQQFSGRLSGYLSLNDQSFENVTIEAFNIALFGVDQRMITGKEP